MGTAKKSNSVSYFITLLCFLFFVLINKSVLSSLYFFDYLFVCLYIVNSLYTQCI